VNHPGGGVTRLLFEPLMNCAGQNSGMVGRHARIQTADVQTFALSGYLCELRRVLCRVCFRLPDGTNGRMPHRVARHSRRDRPGKNWSDARFWRD
jgi:hypothetical protein